jgi:NADH-quinone oxidoreductase subunit N
MTIPTFNLMAILPQIILVAAALLVLMTDLVLRNKRILAWLSLLAVVGSLAVTLLQWPGQIFNLQSSTTGSMALADGLGIFAAAAISIAAGLAILLALERTEDFTRRPGPYYALILLASAGMIAMAQGNDFLIIFLGLEIFSLALYILTGFARRDARSAEASLKYFLLGAFASGFFLYGIALIYGATGTTNLTQISQGIAPLSVSLPFAPLLPLGAGLLLVGYGFKVALVPFHQWTPDVYQGAPTSVTAFMSVATKTAAFASLIRVLASLVSHDRPWLTVLAVLAVLTMTLGNLAALRQTSLKRMLAYSSIAHAGYVLVGLAAGTAAGAQAALYYLLAYTFMNLGAFAVLLAVQRRDENDVTLERITGLSSRQPGMAVLMAILMFALTGIPPLAGFFGKLYVFGAAVQANLAWLAIVAVLNSAIAAYYYLRVTVTMFMADPRPAGAEVRKPGWPVWTTVVITTAATLVLGLWQFPWVRAIQQAVSTLGPLALR